jgi:hypothetical protein
VDAEAMVGVRAPHVLEEPVPILTPDDLKALATCKGPTFADWRATVIIGYLSTRACVWPRRPV